tara:strand:- start:446 stop:571 length:126 start_codon:yes stop_codon:yes gene_type:complete
MISIRARADLTAAVPGARRAQGVRHDARWWNHRFARSLLIQ